VSCKRCDAWLYDCPESLIAINEYIKNTELGVRYIKSVLKTKLMNVEYRRKSKDMPDEEIPVDTSCLFYKANMVTPRQKTQGTRILV
jgi:hypothetical protein